MFGVVLDACVLIPASLRDTLLRAASENLYRLQCTNDILEEVRRNRVKQGASEANAQKLIDAIKASFPEAFVTQYDQFIPIMPINQKDRHVLAAAVASHAQVIVTQNLKDFPSSLLGFFEVEAQSPDDFLVNLFYLAPERMLQIMIMQARELRKPAKTVFEVLEILKQHAPYFVKLVLQDLSDTDIP
jgi:predicted nucleic acid-binding protein